MPTWPTGLSYKVDMGAFRVLEITRPAIVTEFEDGPPLARRSGAGQRAKVAYRIPWSTHGEADQFLAFYEDDLIDGTARFTMPVWIPSLNDYAERTVMFEQAKATVEPFGLGFAMVANLWIFKWRSGT